ncbi:hypothetical protein ABTC19_19090, partial [Acinetobacter baumannii]
RCLSVLAGCGHDRILIVKGAPEAIIARAVAVEIDGLPRPLSPEWIERITKLQDDFARDGFRLLGVAVKSLPEHQCKATVEDERGLT